MESSTQFRKDTSSFLTFRLNFNALAPEFQARVETALDLVITLRTRAVER